MNDSMSTHSIDLMHEDQKRSKVSQFPETIAEFGTLQPVCEKCHEAIKSGDGLVSFRWNSETNETIKSTVRVTHFDCDPNGHDPFRAIEEVFDFKGSGQRER